MALRLLATLLAVLVLAGMTIHTSSVGTSMVLLADRSDSMNAVQMRLEEDLTRLKAGASWGDTVQTVDFADAAIISGEESAALNTAATNLADALHAASSLLQGNAKHQIVLLTDGLETDGNAATVAALLANRGVRIDALHYDTTITEPEAEVTSIILPTEVAQGKKTRAAVTITSNAAMKGKLSLYDEDVLLRTDTVSIKPGENAYSYRIEPGYAGMRVFSAVLEPADDTLDSNNHATTCAHVVSSSKILIVDGTGSESAALKDMLTAQGMDVTVVACKSIPRTATALCEYGLVILMNVDVLDLQTNSADVLEEYVSVYGRSVLTVGGKQTYALGHMTDTAFEDFLPVTMTVEDEESAESVALLLLIDNSASMSETATNLAVDTATPAEMAKMGAIKSISALHDNDYVGVVTFSNTYHVLAELTPIPEKDTVISAISRMGTISGTAYAEAFQAAYDMLSVFHKTDRKHVLFLSDGNPSDEGYEAIVQRMTEAGITTSVIGIGSYMNGEIMENLAKIGGGYYSVALTAHDLPALMLSDTLVHQVDYEMNLPFRATLAQKAQSLYRPTVMPTFGGYVRVGSKPEADVLMTAPNDHPLYVQWQYGSGMAGALTSDVGGEWTPDLLADEEASRLILSMIQNLMPAESGADAVQVSMRGGGATYTLSVACVDASQVHGMTATITTPTGREESIELSPVRTGVYEKTLDMDGYGKYDLSLQLMDASGLTIHDIDTATTLTWSPEYRVAPTEAEKAVLASVCEISGGSVYDSADALMNAALDDLFVDVDPKATLAGLALLLVCAELIVRRIRPRGKKKTGKAI